MYTILHIDASYFFRKIFNDLFSKAGIKYIGASTLDDAMFELRSNPKINIILTAVEFENEKIEPFIESLSKSEFKNIPIFVITSNTSVEKRMKVFDMGVVDYILKNTPIDEIVNNVISFTRESELLQLLRDAEIAVLDDSRFELERLREIFNANNIKNVRYFHKPEDLINLNHKFDIYLVDMVLKNSSGERVLVKIRESDKHVPIIAVSSIANSKTISHILLAGANDYIVKPYAQEIMLARLEIALRNFEIIKDLKNEKIMKLATTFTDSWD